MTVAKRAKERPAKTTAVRGAPVIDAVLRATIEELAKVGFGALRVEDVAAQAKVARTTVYRRWPTKGELVQAALRMFITDKMREPNTGSLRGDLVAIGRNMLAFVDSAQGRGLSRALLEEGRDGELAAIAQKIKDEREATPRLVVERAIQRGELEDAAHGKVLLDTFASSVHAKNFLRRHVDAAYLERVIDLLLHGALRDKRRKAPKPRLRRKKPSA